MSNMKPAGYLNKFTGMICNPEQQPGADSEPEIYEPLVRLSDVHGLVAENTALNGAIERVSGVYKLSPHIQKLCEIKTPNTDAFTAELRAQGVDEYANATIAIGEDERNLDIIYAGNQAKLFAKHLRAGRKG